MEFYDDLKEYLVYAQSADGPTRVNGENQIKSLRDRNPKTFLASLTREIANEE